MELLWDYIYIYILRIKVFYQVSSSLQFFTLMTARHHKLAKTMELQNFGDDDDIFSNLPNHIVHRILFFLQLVDLSRLSCVSRRCKELCISNPCLALTNIIYDTLQSPPRFQFNNFMNRFRFKNFVDRFMAQRSLYGVKTQRLYLRWCLEGSLEDATCRINTWLYHAVNSGLEKLQIVLIF